MEVQEPMMSRRGFSLLETMVVVTAMTAILAAAVVLLGFVLRMDGEARRRTHAVATIGRLAEQFRQDVHQARGEPTVAADHRTAEFHLPGGRVVRWRIDGDCELVRTEPAHGGAGVPPADREESYTLPKGTTAALESQSQGAARIVAIRIESLGTSGPCLAIEALASRDQRLAAAEEKP